MFPSSSQRRTDVPTDVPVLRRALALARAFILLEDPELSGAHGPGERSAHPHRVSLRSRPGARRPGAGVPRPQHCLTPIRQSNASITRRPTLGKH